MPRVITFSRVFPSYHPRKGEQTHFVEKVWESLLQAGEISTSRCCELSRETGIGGYDMNSIRKINFDPKGHTIRAGHRWKVGDFFSPRVWVGKPYNSKQITFAPDIEIKKVWNFKIHDSEILIDNERVPANEVPLIAANDGLNFLDFMHWFQYPKVFDGQIICWSDAIEYKTLNWRV